MLLQEDLTHDPCREPIGEVFRTEGLVFHTYELRFNAAGRAAELWIDGQKQSTSGYVGHIQPIGHNGPGVLWGANSDCHWDTAHYQSIQLRFTGLPGVEPGGILFDEVNPANGHRYYLLYRTSWPHAQSIAEGLNGNLATISDRDEQDWVWTRFSDLGQRDLWNGLNDVVEEGKFEWANGEPVVFTNWAPGEPDNGCGCADYVLMSAEAGGAWDDQCSVARFAVVELDRTCVADINGDGVTDAKDLTLMLAAWLSKAGDPNWDPRADLNGDNVIDARDLTLLLADWFCGKQP